MSRYLTGINSYSFDLGYDPATNIFDKSKIPAMDESNKIYFVKNPLGFFYDSKALLFKKKSAARLALGLAAQHGGKPLVIECSPNLKKTRVCCPGRRNYCVQDSPQIGVEKLFLVEKFFSLRQTNFFCSLKEISVENYLKNYFKK